MYSLKVVPMAKATELNKAINEYLVDNKINMIDRRAALALVLAKVVSGAIPVVQLQGANSSAQTWREQHLPVIKEWLGRFNEIATIDIDVILIGAYNEWVGRCRLAFPESPLICVKSNSPFSYGSDWKVHQGALAEIEEKYDLCNLPNGFQQLLVNSEGMYV